MNVFKRRKKISHSEDDEASMKLSLDWDTAYGEITFALTMVTLSMLFVVSNTGTYSDPEVTDLIGNKLGAAMQFHGYPNFLTYEEGFVVSSWLAVWLCAAAWAGGLRLYVSYLLARLTLVGEDKPIYFMKQYGWELQAVYYLLMISLVPAGTSTYYVYMYATPIRSGSKCISAYSPSEEQIHRGTRDGELYCLRRAHFFIMYSAWLWIPVSGVVVLWMWRESRLFTTRASFKRCDNSGPNVPTRTTVEEFDEQLQ
eukprot:8577691-Pyramimonas_sp.AAC.1